MGTGRRVLVCLAGASSLIGAGCGDSGGNGDGPVQPATATRVAADSRPRGVVEDCSSKSQAWFPDTFSDPETVAVGPVALLGAAWVPPNVVRQFGGDKIPVLVRHGHRVTIEVPRRLRRVVGLAYGRLPEGDVRLRDAHRVATFIACRGDKESGSRAGRKRVTFWSGFVLTSASRCVPLKVWVDDDPLPRETILRMGIRRCD